MAPQSKNNVGPKIPVEQPSSDIHISREIKSAFSFLGNLKSRRIAESSFIFFLRHPARKGKKKPIILNED